MGDNMKKSKVQFQKGYSILEFMDQYGTDEQCRKSLESFRWPNGFVCPICFHKNHCYIESRKLYQCTRCKFQTSITKDTVFHSTKLPLVKWFLSMYLLSQSKNGISALELKRQVGVSYKTAWKVKHKLMQVMAERDENKKLSGLIQVDDAYLGGQKNGGKRGRGSENKQPFIAAVTTTDEEHPLYVKLTPVKSFTKKEIEKWGKANLAPDCSVATDGLNCFNAFSDSKDLNHIRIVMKPDEKTGEKPYFNFKWVNTIIGNVKNAITGTYRSSENGYATRYLAEFQYRINRRFNLQTILPRLIYASVHTPPLPGKVLKRAAFNT